jgi:ribulose-phosphate 3-epimerase
MIEIIPAILPKNYEDMKDKIALVRGHAELVQIDFCDGIFVPSRTWPFSTGGGDDYYFQRIINEQEGMPFWEDLDFELDLMVADAISNFDIYTKLSPKRIIFHLESVGNTEEFKDFLEGIDVYVRDSIEMGIAIGLTTPIEQIYPLANSVDFVQVMGIEKIGIQGEEFSAKAIEYVKNLREKFGDLPIAVDGGVNLENALKLIDAGATRLAIGSAIFNTTDIIYSIEEFKQLG